MKLLKLFCFLYINIALISNVMHASESQEQVKLANVHKKIQLKFSNIKHIDAEEFSKLEQEQTLVFDVREPSEFGISHLDKAIQINPQTSTEDFLNEFIDELENKHVVFYCSVGERSSLLATQLQKAIQDGGAKEVYNLVGGLFNWHNEKRPLMQEDTKTTLIHPYNRRWSRLIEDKDSIRYKPNSYHIELK